MTQPLELFRQPGQFAEARKGARSAEQLEIQPVTASWGVTALGRVVRMPDTTGRMEVAYAIAVLSDTETGQPVYPNILSVVSGLHPDDTTNLGHQVLLKRAHSLLKGVAYDLTDSKLEDPELLAVFAWYASKRSYVVSADQTGKELRARLETSAFSPTENLPPSIYSSYRLASNEEKTPADPSKFSHEQLYTAIVIVAPSDRNETTYYSYGIRFSAGEKEAAIATRNRVDATRRRVGGIESKTYIEVRAKLLALIDKTVDERAEILQAYGDDVYKAFSYLIGVSKREDFEQLVAALYDQQLRPLASSVRTGELKQQFANVLPFKRRTIG